MKSFIIFSIFYFFFLISLSYAQQHSTGKAPLSDKQINETKTGLKYSGQTTGYGGDGIGGDWYSVDIPGGGLTPLGTQNFLMQGADFANDTYYAINGDTGELITVDISDGTPAVVATVTGISAGQTITALGYDELNNIMYLGTTDINTSELYTINLNTAEATLVGTIGQAGLIALLVTCEGEIYSVDIVDDQLWSIDPSTGAGTPVGSLGYDANFAQDADVDAATGIGYLAAYNNTTSSGQLREVDFVTGNTTIIADWTNVELTGFGIDEICGPPCPLDDPTNPDPPDGATDLPVSGTTLTWQNDPEADEIEIFFGPEGNMTSHYQGPPVTFYDPGLLGYNTEYQWRIDQIDTDIPCTSTGTTWSFTTEQDPNLFQFFDDFYTGLINWNITNDGGDCVWEIHQAIEYDLPPEGGNVMAADADDCGTGTTTITTSTLEVLLDVDGHNTVYIIFNNDFFTAGNSDYEANVDISIDGGNNWLNVWNKVGVDLRNTNELIEISEIAGCSEFKVRFRAFLNGDEGWWAVDDFQVLGFTTLSAPQQPSNLTSEFVNVNPPTVQLNWEFPSFYGSGFEIERKPADSSFVYFQRIDSIPGIIESYTDNTVELNSSYTYRVRAFVIFVPNEIIYSCYSNYSDVDTEIPVELISFTANIVDNKVHLNWKTATELNNKGFEVQRSQRSNVKGQTKDWTKIGFVDGNGTTTEEQIYSFVDNEQLFGKYKYRLKQIDYDGSYEYSNEVEVDFGMLKEFSLEQNYPNPFNPATTIKFTLPGNTDYQSVRVRLAVYDILGNEVTTLFNEEKEPGVYEVEFDARDLSSGMYIYRIQAGDFVSTKKMILLR